MDPTQALASNQPDNTTAPAAADWLAHPKPRQRSRNDEAIAQLENEPEAPWPTEELPPPKP